MSLKLKFQLGIIFIVSVLTIVTVQVTKKVYTNDKLISVYEKSNLEQEVLKNRIIFQRELAETKSLRYLETYLNRKGKIEDIRQNFRRDPVLYSLHVSEKGTKVLELEKDKQAPLECNSDKAPNLFCHDFKVKDYDISIAFDLSEVVKKLDESTDLKTAILRSKSASAPLPQEVSSALQGSITGSRTFQTTNFLITNYADASEEFQLVSYMAKDRAFAEIEELTRQIYFIALLIGLSCLIAGIVLANGLTSKLNNLAEYAKEIAKGNFSLEFNPVGSDEVAELGKAFGKMKKDLVFYIEEQKSKVRMQHELEVAQVVQRSFFGPSQLKNSFSKIVTKIHPTSECGGDWCFSETLESGTLFGIGDATGHGAGAALTTAAIYSGMKIISNSLRTKVVIEDDLKEAVKTLNLVLNMPEQGQLMTFVLGYLPKGEEALYIINQGHHPPLIINRDSGSLESLPLKPTDRLGEKTVIEPEVHKIPFSKSHLCMLFTDGLVEIKASNDFTFNRKKMLRDLTALKPRSSDDLANFLEERIGQITSLNLNEDDICYVIAARD